MGEGEARPTAPDGTVMGRPDGVERPAAEGEDTARLADDAATRRLPFDRPDRGCWADLVRNRKAVGREVSAAAPRRSPARPLCQGLAFGSAEPGPIPATCRGLPQIFLAKATATLRAETGCPERPCRRVRRWLFETGQGALRRQGGWGFPARVMCRRRMTRARSRPCRDLPIGFSRQATQII